MRDAMTARALTPMLVAQRMGMTDKYGSAVHNWMKGKTLNQIAQAQNKRIIDAFLDLVVEEKLETVFMQAENNIDVDAMREMYPHLEQLNLLGQHARVVVSEPLNDLPGMFREIPESSLVILDESGDFHHEPFLDPAPVG